MKTEKNHPRKQYRKRNYFNCNIHGGTKVDITLQISSYQTYCTSNQRIQKRAWMSVVLKCIEKESVRMVKWPSPKLHSTRERQYVLIKPFIFLSPSSRASDAKSTKHQNETDHDVLRALFARNRDKTKRNKFPMRSDTCHETHPHQLKQADSAGQKHNK